MSITMYFKIADRPAIIIFELLLRAEITSLIETSGKSLVSEQ
jgi:hypothetical protein